MPLSRPDLDESVEAACLIFQESCTDMLSTETGGVNRSQWCFLDPDNPCPFEELLVPFVVRSHQRYAGQAQSAHHLLNSQAQIVLQRHLLHVLTSLSVQALYTEFSRMRTQWEQELSQAVDGRACYQQFITHMYQGAMAVFLRKYPVLAHLLATISDLWVEAHVEFLQRLAADWPLIQQTFGRERELGQVEDIQPALSDPHNGRRSVMALTFTSGIKLVYKPKDVGMEENYNRLLAWCNERGVTPPLRVLTVINRLSYGWVEFVEHAPCLDQQALQHYYQRFGMLLCLVYVLGGVNYTYEHFVASGEHPVLVDADMLMHHYPCPDHQDANGQHYCSDWEHLAFSVLHTGLLTNWQMCLHPASAADMSVPGIDISALGMGSEHKAPSREAAQAHTNSQQALLKYGMLKSRRRMPTSAPDGLSTRRGEYLEDILTGFRQVYLLLLEQRDALLSRIGLFQNLRHQQVRFLYCPVGAYHHILQKLLTPEYLSDIALRGMLLERPANDLIPVEYKLWRDGNDARWRSVALAERQALAQGDIPFFRVRAGGNDLTVAPDSHVSSCFHRPSFDLVVARFMALSEKNMRQQVGCIERALRARITLVAPHMSAGSSADGDTPRTEDTAPRGETLVGRAMSIAEDLAAQAIPMGDGSRNWLTPKFLFRSQRYQIQPMRYSVFDGASGVALFLAAAARISAEARYRELALAAIRPLRRIVYSNGEQLVREMGIGGAVGLGSAVYALTRIAQFLDEPVLLTDAKQAAMLLQPAHITADRALDVVAGSAGAILGLLALYETSQDQVVLERAMLCGQHLLRTRTMSKAGCLAWPTMGGRHTTGFSHGTAGIAYALVRLYLATRDPGVLAAAGEAFLYEDRAFISEIGNWSEELGDGDPVTMTAWCHGAPGIGLARLGGLAGMDNEHIRQTIEVAIQTTQRVGIRELDHLCCGNAGRADILLTAALRLGRPDLAVTAKRNVWSVVTRAERQGSLNLNDVLPRWVPLLNFFHGTSGIGYTLLRMAHPSLLPSVLLWE